MIENFWEPSWDVLDWIDDRPHWFQAFTALPAVAYILLLVLLDWLAGIGHDRNSHRIYRNTLRVVFKQTPQGYRLPASR